MSTKIIAYQQRAKAELAEAVLSYKRSSSEIVLSAPTGSGKTTIAYMALKEVYDRLEEHATLPLFVWVSVGNLASQSLADFQKKAANQTFYKLVSAEDVVGDRVGDNAMLFVNWEKIVGDDVLLRKDNEKGRTFSGWIDQAKAAGRLVVFLIDEFHLNTSAAGAQGLLAVVNPDKTVYLSATPRDVPGSKLISVSVDEVVAEGVIRKSLVVNPNDQRISSMLTDKNLETSVRLQVEGLMSPSAMLEEGLKLQAMLEQAYRKEGVGLTPLAIVQLPNGAEGDALYKELGLTLSTLGLKEGEIAVSMSYEGSDVQTNFQNISS
jgi:type III restriction enzyme